MLSPAKDLITTLLIELTTPFLHALRGVPLICRFYSDFIAFVAEPALILPPFLTAGTFQALYWFGPIRRDLYLTNNIACF